MELAPDLFAPVTGGVGGERKFRIELARFGGLARTGRLYTLVSGCKRFCSLLGLAGLLEAAEAVEWSADMATLLRTGLLCSQAGAVTTLRPLVRL